MTDHLETPVIVGAGAVGRAVADQLISQGRKPLVVTRSGARLAGANSTKADLAKPEDAKSVLSGASVVFQCSQPPYDRWAEEFPALQHSILACCEASGAALIAVENLYGYGPTNGPMTEATPMRPTTRKGRVRAAMWDELAAAHQGGVVPTAAVRSSDFFGPHVVGSAFGDRFFPPLLAGRKAELYGPAERLHSVTYVPDLALALISVAADSTSWGRAWHAPTAPAQTMRRIVELAAQAAQVSPRSRTVAAWQLKLFGLFSAGAAETVEMLYEFTEDFVVDSSAIEARLDLTSTPLDSSLAETVAWHEAQATS